MVQEEYILIQNQKIPSCEIGIQKLLSVTYIDTMNSLEGLIQELLSTILRKVTFGKQISVFTHSENLSGNCLGYL